MATQTITETATEYPEVEVLTERPIEERKPMKLSEAMRLGAMGTKQAFGSWHYLKDGEDRMCAISTAWYALTGEKSHDGGNTPLHQMLEGVKVNSPVDGVEMSLASAIIGLNDNHHWGRDRIAGWLETQGL